MNLLNQPPSSILRLPIPTCQPRSSHSTYSRQRTSYASESRTKRGLCWIAVFVEPLIFLLSPSCAVLIVGSLPLSHFRLAPSAKPLRVNQTCSMQVEWLRLATRILVVSADLAGHVYLQCRNLQRLVYSCTTHKDSDPCCFFRETKKTKGKENQPPHTIGPTSSLTISNITPSGTFLQ